MNDTPRRTQFYLDKQRKKWMGVCAGIADYTGIDVSIVRIAMVLGVVLGFGALIVVYIAAGLIAPAKPRELAYETSEDAKFWQGVRASPRRTVRDVRSKFREIDRRLADVETYVTSPHGSLSREIENLR
jgi:phage shock protein C